MHGMLLVDFEPDDCSGTLFYGLRLSTIGPGLRVLLPAPSVENILESETIGAVADLGSCPASA